MFRVQHNQIEEHVPSPSVSGCPIQMENCYDKVD